MSPAAKNVLHAVGWQLSAVVFLLGCLYMTAESHGSLFWTRLMWACWVPLIVGLVFQVLAMVRLFRKWSWPAFLVMVVWLWGQVLVMDMLLVWWKAGPMMD